MQYEMRPEGYLRDGFKRLLRFLKQHRPDAEFIVEIGSYTGETAVMLAEEFQNALITCVDNWKGGYCVDERTTPEIMGSVEQAFDARTKSVLNILKVKGDSISIAQEVSEKAYDIIYIDADHSYEAVLSDIRNWQPKLSIGGILCGHDYDPSNPGVMKAVDECFKGVSTIHTFEDNSWAILN